MNELKTLKDLRKEKIIFKCHEVGCSCEEEPHKMLATTDEELRQEAIKWIKEISKGGFRKNPQIKFIEGKLDTSEVSRAILSLETDLVVNWIKHFFNISDNELKLEEDGE